MLDFPGADHHKSGRGPSVQWTSNGLNHSSVEAAQCLQLTTCLLISVLMVISLSTSVFVDPPTLVRGMDPP